MAINVMMTDDIRKYETKQFGPFTTRQAICIVAALGYSIPIGVCIPTSISNKILLIAIMAIPVILMGYIKMDGAHFETLILRILYEMVLTPRRRKYKSENTFRTALKQMDDNTERRKMARMTRKEQKKYMQAKNIKKTVHYSRKRVNKVYM